MFLSTRTTNYIFLTRECYLQHSHGEHFLELLKLQKTGSACFSDPAQESTLFSKFGKYVSIIA